jgi:iron complex outermembrane receptor protein
LAKTSTENWKFMTRGSYNTHSDYRGSKPIPVTMRLILKPESVIIAAFSSVLRYNYNKLDLGIPEDGMHSKRLLKHHVSKTRVLIIC